MDRHAVGHGDGPRAPARGRPRAGGGFYHLALGFDKVVWCYPGALFLSAGGYHHHLGTNTWSSGPPASPGDARLLQWAILLPAAADIADAARSLRAAGHEALESEEAMVSTDPWGTSVRLALPR